MGDQAGGEDGGRERGAVDHQGDGPQPDQEGQDHGVKLSYFESFVVQAAKPNQTKTASSGAIPYLPSQTRSSQSRAGARAPTSFTPSLGEWGGAAADFQEVQVSELLTNLRHGLTSTHLHSELQQGQDLDTPGVGTRQPF